MNFEEIIKYRLDRHNDIHLLVGGKIQNIIFYAPETFQTIFLETLKENVTLLSTCKALPFPPSINEEIYRIEMELECKYSVVVKRISPHETIVAPGYFSKKEIICILKNHGVYFDGDVVFGGKIESDSSPFDKYSFERFYFGDTIGEIRFLRELASNGGSEDTAELQYFYNIGASIIGPVYALYAEWILRFCKSHTITKLLPMMREATVLIDCIKQLGSIDCSPLFCSRRFLFNASINNRNFDEKISQILVKSKSTPMILCKDIGLDGSPFLSYKTMEELKKAGEIKHFSDYLFTNRDSILSFSKQQRAFFCDTLTTLIDGRKTATVDIGFSGTSESLIRDILKMENQAVDLSHLILVGADNAQIKNIRGGLKIYSWLGMAGENTDITKRLMYQIQVIEPLINDICGTTLAYNSKGPVIDSIVPAYLDRNFPKALACQRGISAFTELWKEYREQFDTEILLRKKIGFINIWRRLIETPSIEDARFLGGLLLYDNYTIEKEVYPVCDMVDKEFGNIDQYLENISRSKSDYPQARVVIRHPDYFKTKLIEKSYFAPGINRMIEIINSISGNHIAIFAAGQRGRDFLKIARLFGLDIECFIDSDKKKQGTMIDGIPVIAIEEAKNITTFINASYNYPSEINRTIMDLWGYKNPEIFSFE